MDGLYCSFKLSQFKLNSL
ncbi:hypothetical protein A2U01_0058799, partial [Trifolium medium]|nr:hypothetical protein [Trifolium medium]